MDFLEVCQSPPSGPSCTNTRLDPTLLTGRTGRRARGTIPSPVTAAAHREGGAGRWGSLLWEFGWVVGGGSGRARAPPPRRGLAKGLFGPGPPFGR